MAQVDFPERPVQPGGHTEGPQMQAGDGNRRGRQRMAQAGDAAGAPERSAPPQPGLFTDWAAI